MSRFRPARFSTLRNSVAVTSLALILTSCAATLPAPPAGPLAPGRGVLLGAYVKPAGGYSRTDVRRAAATLEQELGRPLAINMHYYHWGWRFPTWSERDDTAARRIPLVSWGRFSTAAIADGSQDRLIERRARSVAAFGAPLFIRWFHEMDGGNAALDAGSPERFVTAWRHIHSIFLAEGATNAVWAWCPNAGGFTSGRAQRFYPGDRYVDWICADGYNWSPLESDGTGGGAWRSFGDVFSAFYAWASPHSKPLMIGETATQEGAPGQKAEWIRDMGRDLRTRFPAIEALVWFDAIAPSNQGGMFDWRIDSSPTSRSAFRDLARSPYFDPDTLRLGDRKSGLTP
jgi:hypothetical protein